MDDVRDAYRYTVCEMHSGDDTIDTRTAPALLERARDGRVTMLATGQGREAALGPTLSARSTAQGHGYRGLRQTGRVLRASRGQWGGPAAPGRSSCIHSLIPGRAWRRAFAGCGGGNASRSTTFALARNRAACILVLRLASVCRFGP
jgi:hypothetical protein